MTHSAKPQQEYRFFALMRSGHHTIINCIYSDLNKAVAFANNITGILWNPNDIDQRYDRFVALFEAGLAHRNTLIDVSCDIRGCWVLPIVGKNITDDIEILLCNVEDDPTASYANGVPCPKEHLTFSPTPKLRRIGVGAGIVKNVLILRDPYNFIASRMAMQPRTNIDLLSGAVDSWCVHAKEYLRMTNLLDDPILISYNEWVMSRRYRKRTSEQFGCDFTDNHFHNVPPYGGGSSFSALSPMTPGDTLRRYERYLDDPEYTKMIKNEELQNLSKKIFGPIIKKKLF